MALKLRKTMGEQPTNRIETENTTKKTSTYKTKNKSDPRQNLSSSLNEEQTSRRRTHRTLETKTLDGRGHCTKKKEDIEELGEISHRLDLQVIVLQETGLQLQKRFTLGRFVIYRNNWPVRRGGSTTILITRNIQHIQLLTPHHFQEVEATVIEVIIDNQHKNVSVYLPPIERTSNKES